MGFYMAYVRDKELTENNYSFERYVADLAAGRNMNVQFYGVKLDGSVGTFIAKPGVIEFVAISPDTTKYGDTIVTTKPFRTNGYGYQEKQGGGLRIVSKIDGTVDDDWNFCQWFDMNYELGFGVMGAAIRDSTGDWPLYGFPLDKFPKALDRMNKAVVQREIYTQYGLNSWIFIQPY